MLLVRWLQILLCVLFLSTATCLQANPFESLVSPGDVISGHAKDEQKCEKCHEPFSQSVQNKLCLDCHKDTAADLKSREGFHGRLKDIESRPCKSCHTDHKGRDFKIVLLDKDTFDHGKTDFQLKGAHNKVECGACHKPKKKLSEAPKLCIDCHKEDDPHRGRLGEKCADCHDEKTWKQGKFDHDKTKFHLEGGHKDVSCNKCHPDQRWKETPTDCNACHQINDVHNGSLGTKCDKCHNVKKWTEDKFDHDRDTKFKLTGKHDNVKCEGCHKNNAYDVKLATTCISCHKKDDEHKGRYGAKCENCHTTENWIKSTFDHDKTDYKLRNKHEKVPCEGCHKGNLYEEKLKTTCISCHKKDDVHKKQEGEVCEKCHNDRGWREKVAFSHDLTKFPLIGLHQITPCDECHLTPSYKDADLECIACHKKDDVHKLSLGKVCEQCHNPNGWRIWEYDHSKTDFPLEGAHEKLVCKACHKEPVEKDIELPMRCYDCHQKDDAHRGTYGQNCERCHVASSFRELKMNFK